MKISDILSKKCVFAHVAATDKKTLLQDLSTTVAESCGADTHQVADSVWERENLGSTGYGNGTAFPHARIDGLKEIRAAFAQLDRPIEFDAVDHKPVDLVFVLISPENSGADHLTALAAVSRVLKDELTCEKLRQATTADELYQILTERMS
jgi:PTS system nitrogen regulatory IIA component